MIQKKLKTFPSGGLLGISEGRAGATSGAAAAAAPGLWGAPPLPAVPQAVRQLPSRAQLPETLGSGLPALLVILQLELLVV